MAEILVLGASGTIGIEVVKALAKKDIKFKAAVHNISKSENLKKISSKIEVVEVDIYSPESLAKAFQGVKSLFVLTPPGQSVAPNQIIAAEAKKAKIKHIVKLSALGTVDPKFIIGQEHIVAEKCFADNGLSITSLRPSSFMSNNAAYFSQSVKEQGKIYAAFANTRINQIAPSDIGEAAAVILTTSGHEGKVYDLTGPDTITYSDVAKILSELLKKDVAYVPIDDATLRKQAATFMPPAAIDPFSNLIQKLREGMYDVKSNNNLKTLLGREGIHLKDWLNAGAISAFK